jgi:hypothetical protein
MSSAGLGPESDCTGKAQKQLYSKLQTRPLVREGAPHKETLSCPTESENLAMGAQHQDSGRLTVSRNVT